MLTSHLGIRLILWLGESVPLPAPYEVMRAVDRVEVTSDAQNGDGFQISFLLSKNQPSDYSLLQGGLLDPPTRVVIAVLLGVMPQVLIDGIITHHQHAPSAEPGQSKLTVSGKDLSVMLDLEEKIDKHENQPDFAVATKLITAYKKYGLLPEVTLTTGVPLIVDLVPFQSHETDLQYIQRMARRNGFVFYIEPKTFLLNNAYWGPPKRSGVRQPALRLGPGPSANLKSIDFSLDALAPIGTEGKFVPPIGNTALPIPPLPSLRTPPLARRPVPALRTTITSDTANQDAGKAANTALASGMNAPEPVVGTGEIDTIRYGNVLRARKLVGVAGTGTSYDGDYYVRRVSHSISVGEYKQTFELGREGTGALKPRVTP